MAVAEPGTTGTAGDRFELVVDDEGRIGWLKAVIFAFVGGVTFGTVELYPKATVRVRDRISGDDVVTQTWRDPRDTTEAIAQLEEDLMYLTPDDFLHRWSSSE